MTRRDRVWRAGGVALLVTGLSVSLFGRIEPPAVPLAVTGPIGFVLAVLGIVLLVQGKRVPMGWRIERSRHRALPAAIRSRHVRSKFDSRAERRG